MSSSTSKSVSYRAPTPDVEMPPLPTHNHERRGQSCIVEPGAPPTFFQRASQVGSGVRSSFSSALKEPTLGRFAVSWLAPSPFPDPPGLGTFFLLASFLLYPPTHPLFPTCSFPFPPRPPPKKRPHAHGRGALPRRGNQKQGSQRPMPAREWVGPCMDHGVRVLCGGG